MPKPNKQKPVDLSLKTPEVPIGDIYVGERFRKQMGKIEELAIDIKTNGLIHPIALRPPTDEERELGVKEPYVLVAGGRRHAAHAYLGKKTIPAHIREQMDELQARVLELTENVQRKAMEWQEEVSAKEEILRLRRLQNPEITDHEVADEIGVSAATFSRDVKTASAVKENPSLAKSGSKHAALRAAEVARRGKAKAKTQATRTETFGQLVQQRLVTADMREWLLEKEAASCDLLCADLPYGIDYFKVGQKAKNNEHLSKFDDTPESIRALYLQVVPLFVKVTRETGWVVCFTGKELYGYLEQLFTDCCYVHADYRASEDAKHCLSYSKEAEHEKCRFLIPEPLEWIWFRPNSNNSPRYPEYHARNDFERILAVNMGQAVLYGELPVSNVMVAEQVYGGSRIHVNEKPIALYKQIIDRTTQEGDTVFDPCFGSGNALAAAGETFREPFGCDNNPGMLDAAVGKVLDGFRPITQAVAERAVKRRMMREGGEVDERIYDYTEEVAS